MKKNFKQKILASLLAGVMLAGSLPYASAGKIGKYLAYAGSTNSVRCFLCNTSFNGIDPSGMWVVGDAAKVTHHTKHDSCNGWSYLSDLVVSGTCKRHRVKKKWKCGYVETTWSDYHTGKCDCNFGLPVVTKAATCTEEGISTRSCRHCTNSKTTVIAKTSHSFDWTGEDAACSTEGCDTKRTKVHFDAYSIQDDVLLRADIVSSDSVEIGQDEPGTVSLSDFSLTFPETIDGMSLLNEQSEAVPVQEGGVHLKVYYSAPETVLYQVEHWKQNFKNKEYTLAKVEPLEGSVGEAISFSPKALFKGLDINESKSVLKGTVTKDDPLVLKAFYDRHDITVTVNDEPKTIPSGMTADEMIEFLDLKTAENEKADGVSETREDAESSVFVPADTIIEEETDWYIAPSNENDDKNDPSDENGGNTGSSDENGDNADQPDENDDNKNSILSAFVPVELPLKMDADGNLTVPTNASIRNNTNGKDIVVSDIKVAMGEGWKGVPYTEDTYSMAADTQAMGLRLRGDDMQKDGSFTLTSENWLIEAGQSLPLQMEAKIPKQTVAGNKGKIATIEYTLELADPNRVQVEWENNLMIPGSGDRAWFSWAADDGEDELEKVESDNPDVAVCQRDLMARAKGFGIVYVEAKSRGIAHITGTMASGKTASFTVNVSELANSKTLESGALQTEGKAMLDPYTVAGDALNMDNLQVTVPVTQADGSTADAPVTALDFPTTPLQAGDNDIAIPANINGVEVIVQLHIKVKD